MKDWLQAAILGAVIGIVFAAVFFFLRGVPLINCVLPFLVLALPVIAGAWTARANASAGHDSWLDGVTDGAAAGVASLLVMAIAEVIFGGGYRGGWGFWNPFGLMGFAFGAVIALANVVFAVLVGGILGALGGGIARWGQRA